MVLVIYFPLISLIFAEINLPFFCHEYTNVFLISWLLNLSFQPNFRPSLLSFFYFLFSHISHLKF